MSKEKLLTVRWNNILSVALGIPAVLYIAYALFTGVSAEQSGLIGLAIIGVIY